jgi:2',3'-cyclic-nucleotide 2'-phosphodiesterase (5'-nucleotidase family)
VSRSFRAVLVAFLFLALPCVPVARAQTPPQAVPLTILHTNDTHSHLLPFSYPTVGADADTLGIRERTDIGGIARRATLVKQIREQQARRKTTVWLLDAGDFSDGSPFSTEYRGEADIEAMNAAGYDLGTLGNHEFNMPLEQLRKVIGLAKFPLLCANATETATGKPLAPAEFQIRTVGPLRIGVFGLLTREASTYPAAKEAITVAGEVETAKRMVALLRPKVDIVIALSHAGRALDEQIGQQVPGIDVIVGGHSHSRLPAGELMWRSEDLKVDDVNGTVIVQAHQWGGELGRLDLLFVKDATGAWHVDRYRAQLIPITAALAPDPAVTAVVDRFWQPIAVRYGEVLGQADGDFGSRGDDEANYNLVADAVRETFEVDFDLENTGGVRAPLVSGKITRGDMLTLDPFINNVIRFTVTGKQLKQILAQFRPAVSGVRYRVENRQLVEASIDGKPIDDARVYRGTTNSYLANQALKGIETEDTKRARVDVVIEYVKKKGTVKPVYDGRRIVTGR